MKKIFTKRLVAFVCAAIMLAGFLALLPWAKLTEVQAERIVLADDDPHVLSSMIESEHRAFQSANGGDRRSFLQNSYDYESGMGTKAGEQLAADYIMGRLTEFGYGTEFVPNGDGGDSGSAGEGTVMISMVDTYEDGGISAQIIFQPFSQVFTENQTSIWSQPAQHTLWSQNVILRFDNPNTDKRVILGANMDNDFVGGESEGALAGGSGVAILLALADYLGKNMASQDTSRLLPYDLDIVFFGAGLYNGAHHYIGSENYLTSNSFGKILLMANVGRIGGETTYVYSDEAKTKLQDYALQTGKDFAALPKSLPQLSPSSGTPDNIPYAHFGMIGNHAKFMQRGIPVVNLFCGDYGGITLLDKEGSGGILAKDTVENMLTAYPNAYEKMTDVFLAILDMATDNGLDAVVSQSQAGKTDYLLFMQQWIAYLILGALLLILFVVLLSVSRRLVAKYPPAGARPKPKSVFGEDYDGTPFV